MNIYFQCEAVVKPLSSVGAAIRLGKPAPSWPGRIDPEPAQIDQHLRLQKFLRRHRQRALRAVGASE